MAHGTGTSLFSAVYRGQQVVVKTPRETADFNEVMNLVHVWFNSLTDSPRLRHPSLKLNKHSDSLRTATREGHLHVLP